MKKSLTLALLATCLVANSQTSTVITSEEYGWIPAELVKDSKSKFWTITDDGSISIFDENIEKVKTFTPKSETCTHGEYIKKRNLDGEWIIVEDYRHEDKMHVEYAGYHDVDKNIYGEYSVGITQTFFNDDDKYEYLFPKCTVVEEYDQYDRDGDGEIDEVRIYQKPVCTGYDVLSEDGSVVATIDLDANISHEECSEDVELISWCGKSYLKVWWEDYDDETGEYNEYISFHLYDKATTAVTKVSDAATMRLMPSMARRNQTVSVEIDEETKQNGGELQVTDMNGRTIFVRKVNVGDKMLEIPTSRLTSGMYMVTFKTEGKSIEASKLIVR